MNFTPTALKLGSVSCVHFRTDNVQISHQAQLIGILIGDESQVAELDLTADEQYDVQAVVDRIVARLKREYHVK